MFTEKIKLVLFVAWGITVLLAAIALNVTSMTNWGVVACVAIVPPLVVRNFWHAPEQTMSESIQRARR